MRNVIVVLGLVVVASAGVAAQAPTQRHSLLPAHKPRLSVDFGTKKALTRISQPPPRCPTVRSHRHEMPQKPAGFVELPLYGGHQVRPVPAPPCPVR